MSIPAKEQARRFLAPLKGNLTILLLHQTYAKIELSRFLLRCAGLQSAGVTILDTDAFYCTNLNALAEDSEYQAEVLLPTEQDFDVISLLPLVSSKREFLIIDDLNSLYSLASDGRMSHQLMILMRLLSHNTHANRSWVIATAYRPGLISKSSPTTQRPLTALGDVLVDVEIHNGSLKLRAESEGVWSGDGLNL